MLVVLAQREIQNSTRFNSYLDGNFGAFLAVRSGAAAASAFNQSNVD
jgi:hypothetical protein